MIVHLKIVRLVCSFDEEVEQQVEGEFDAIQEQALESPVEEL